MTNKEKYLKDGVNIEEFIDELHHFWWINEFNVCDGIRTFLNAKAEKKTPTLTKVERIILMNINKEQYAIIGRKLGGSLYLGFKNSVTIDSSFDDFFQKNLFQFITERRRI